MLIGVNLPYRSHIPGDHCQLSAVWAACISAPNAGPPIDAVRFEQEGTDFGSPRLYKWQYRDRPGGTDHMRILYPCGEDAHGEDPMACCRCGGHASE